MTGDIPEPIRAFIAAHIVSIVQLEALLLLRENASQSHSTEEIARKLYCQPEMLGRQLASLQASGLLKSTDKSLVQYQYSPASAELAALTDQLAQIYRDRRVAVTTLIYSDVTNSLRSFSDAFRFRKDTD